MIRRVLLNENKQPHLFPVVLRQHGPHLRVDGHPLPLVVDVGRRVRHRELVIALPLLEDGHKVRVGGGDAVVVSGHDLYAEGVGPASCK